MLTFIPFIREGQAAAHDECDPAFEWRTIGHMVFSHLHGGRKGRFGWNMSCELWMPPCCMCDSQGIANPVPLPLMGLYSLFCHICTRCEQGFFGTR